VITTSSCRNNLHAHPGPDVPRILLFDLMHRPIEILEASPVHDIRLLTINLLVRRSHLPNADILTADFAPSACINQSIPHPFEISQKRSATLTIQISTRLPIQRNPSRKLRRIPITRQLPLLLSRPPHHETPRLRIPHAAPRHLQKAPVEHMHARDLRLALLQVGGDELHRVLGGQGAEVEPAEVEAPVGGDVARDVGGDAGVDEGLLAGEHEGGGAEVAAYCDGGAVQGFVDLVGVGGGCLEEGDAGVGGDGGGELGGVAAETVDVHVGGFEEVFGD
jgi:hypothetical protein